MTETQTQTQNLARYCVRWKDDVGIQHVTDIYAQSAEDASSLISEFYLDSTICSVVGG